MNIKIHQSPVKIYNKDTQFQNQVQQLFELLLSTPATRKEASVLLNIDRANICRYIKSFRDSNRVWIVRKRLCTITRHRAEELTCDLNLAPPSNQLTLF